MRYPIIAFTGSGMGAGKTEAANVFAQRLQGKHTIIKLAKPIYECTRQVADKLGVVFDKAKHRPIMQCIGQTMREAHGPDFWVDAWEASVKHYQFFYNKEDIILVDDVRYDNEAKRIRDLGGVVISIETSAEIRENRIPLIGTDHASEQGINLGLIHATVYNNAGIKEFTENLHYLFETLDAKS